MTTWLTIREAAEALRCSQKHIRRLLDSGRLEFVDIGIGAKKMVRIKMPEPTMRIAEVEKKKKKYVCKHL